MSLSSIIWLQKQDGTGFRIKMLSFSQGLSYQGTKEWINQSSFGTYSNEWLQNLQDIDQNLKQNYSN